MSNGVNKVILVGNLGKAPELRKAGDANVCHFSVATSVTRGSGEDKKDYTTWHQVEVWGPRGESVHKYCDKGRSVYIEGRIQNDSWEDKDGNPRHASKIVATNVIFLGNGNNNKDTKSEGK